MATRSVRVRQHADGHLELLEPVRLPAKHEFPVMIDEALLSATPAQGDGLTASFGAWAGLLDCEEFERDVYTRRHRTREATQL